MGIFDFLKPKKEPGDVTIELDMPASVKSSDGTFEVDVRLYSDAPQLVHRVHVQLVGEVLGGSNAPQTSQEQKTIAKTTNNVRFSLIPGEIKALQFTVTLLTASSTSKPADKADAAERSTETIGRLQSMAVTMDKTYQYYIRVQADVEATQFDNSVSAPILIKHPGQLGATIVPHN